MIDLSKIRGEHYGFRQRNIFILTITSYQIALLTDFNFKKIELGRLLFMKSHLN